MTFHIFFQSDAADEDIFDGSVYEISNEIENENFSATYEEKESQLRKKKILLQKVLRQLRTLINEAELNSAAEKSVRENEKMFKDNEKQHDTESSKLSFSQILPISTQRESEFEPRSSKQEAIPWWERIGSNRH